MPSTYCSSCGHKMDYTLQKPKFCSECGQPLGTLESKAKSKAEDIAPDNLDPEGSEVYEVPEIQSFQYEIEHDQSQSFTLGTLLPDPSLTKKTNKKRGRPRKME
jgi:hypothetical protein